MYIDDAIQLFTSRSRAGVPFDEILQELREQGATLGSAVWAYAEIAQCEISEAKRIVLRHPAWSGFAPATEELDRSIDAFLDRLGKPNEHGEIHLTLEDLDRLA